MVRILSVLLLTVVVALFSANCHAKSSSGKDPDPHCPPSSCGNIPNISYPFRLKGDPEHCGIKVYELECELNRTLVLGNFTSYRYRLSSGKYNVLAINYHNYTIRLADPGLQKGNCSSLPLYSLSNYYYYFDGAYSLYYPILISLPPIPWEIAAAVLVNCEKPIPVKGSPLSNNTAIATATASSSCVAISSFRSYQEPERHSYLLFGSLQEADVADLCRIDQIIVTTTLWMPGKMEPNFSFSDFHSKLAYGFELSWLQSLCEGRCPDYCEIQSDYTPTCYTDSCYSIWFKKQSCFVRRLEIFFYGYILPLLKITGWILVGKPSTGYINYYTGWILAPPWTPYIHPWLKYTGQIFGWIYIGRTLIGWLCLFTFLIYKFKRRHLSMFDIIEGFLQSQNDLMPIRYSYFQIRKMTKGFKDKLGEGGYGTVYKGKLRSGDDAAIKVLGKSKANGQEFINEVATMGRIHHVNVVRLIGFCVTRSKRALVYEFMPNGSLEKYLFSQEGNISLSCTQMYAISLGVARGIEYLHRGCDIQILHFDIKPHNILLDKNFNPKVSDFGLAKLYSTDDSLVSLTAARGTMGYMAPELFYKNIGRVSYKADVYSYGMLLMEMTGRRRNLNAFADHTSQIYFPSWIYDQFKEGNEIDMGESTEAEKEMVRKMVITALWCIQMRPSDRPSMNEVVEMLEGNVEALEMPPKPFLTPQDQKLAEDN